jgi:molybdate transport system regulatory protein
MSSEGTAKREHPSDSDSGAVPASLRLRIDFGEGRRIGPGKIELLEEIGRTGSISAAGRSLGMSYRRAWLLVDEVNKLFRDPVVVAAVGGLKGGGAVLTATGRRLIAAYRRVEARTETAIGEEFASLERDLASRSDAQPA